MSDNRARIKELLKSAQDMAADYMKIAADNSSGDTLSVTGVIKAFSAAAGRTAACLEIMLQQEREIRNLKARLDALEKPTRIHLDKGGPRPPKQ